MPREIHIEVVSDKGRFWPGTAIVKIDGKVVAKLLGDEFFTVTVSDPQIATNSGAKRE